MRCEKHNGIVFKEIFMANKTIITAAITGAIHIPSQTEYLPITPQEIADEAIAAAEAGAAIAHIHVRNPQDGSPTPDLDLFKQVVTRVKAKSDVILCITTGGDPTTMTTAQRLAPVIELEPELASFNGGSFNFALHPLLDKFTEFKYDWEPEYLQRTENNIHTNTFKAMREYLDTYVKTGTKPEFEVYDMGQLNNIRFLIESGKIKKPVSIQFVLGILGGLPATVYNLIHMVDMAEKLIGEGNFVWSIAGAGRVQIPLGTVALTMGGNVRVGLEDSVWLSKGVKARSNAEQVAKIIRIAKELSLETATPEEARAILGLKGIDKVKY
jgi:uncharacterized protein (DUF849 family)